MKQLITIETRCIYRIWCITYSIISRQKNTAYTCKQFSRCRYVHVFSKLYFHKSNISEVLAVICPVTGQVYGIFLTQHGFVSKQFKGHLPQNDKPKYSFLRYISFRYSTNIIIKQVICIKKTSSTIPKARTKTSSTTKTKTMSEDSF